MLSQKRQVPDVTYYVILCIRIPEMTKLKRERLQKRRQRKGVGINGQATRGASVIDGIGLCLD